MTLLLCMVAIAFCVSLKDLVPGATPLELALEAKRVRALAEELENYRLDRLGEKAKLKQRKDEAAWRQHDIATGRISRYNRARKPHIAWVYAGGPKVGYNISPSNTKTKTLCNAQIIPVIAASVSQRLAA